MRKLSSSDRSKLIKLAASLPAGSSERRAILASLRKAALNPAEAQSLWDAMSAKERLVLLKKDPAMRDPKFSDVAARTAATDFADLSRLGQEAAFDLLSRYGRAKSASLESDLKKDADPKSYDQNKPETFYKKKASGDANVPGKHVLDNAKVYGDAYVGENAKVYENAMVADKAYVYDNAEVFGNAKVYGDASVSGNAKVFDKAKIGGGVVSENAKVYGEATVSGDAEVYGDAYVGENAKVYENAQVADKAYVYGNAEVSGYAMVFKNAHVSGNAVVSGRAVVSGNAHISGTAVILGGKWDGSEGPIMTGRWKSRGIPA